MPQPCGLEIDRFRVHVVPMATLNKCMSVLRPLISEGDTNAIGTAEEAVNEYVAAAPATDRKDALLNVQQAVQAHRDEAPGTYLPLADAVNNYIEKLMRSLE